MMKNKNKSFFILCLQTLSWIRFFNACKVLISYHLSLIFRFPINWGIPIVISIEPSSICNLQCPECLSGLKKIERNNVFIDLDIYKKIITEISKKTWIINLYLQGEPLLHPEIIEMIRIAKKEGLMTVISSNGNLISEQLAQDLVSSGLDMLILSIDGWNQDSYEEYRKGGNFEKLLSGMTFLKIAKQNSTSKNPSLVAQSLFTSVIENNIAEIKKIAIEKGFDFTFKSIQVYGNQDENHLLPNKQNQKRYSDSSGDIKLLKKPKNHCRRLWTHSVITTDADMVACCNDKIPNHIFGNICQNDIKTILKSENRINFQKAVLQKKSDINICRNCNL